jgi:hypothetical protein
MTDLEIVLSVLLVAALAGAFYFAVEAVVWKKQCFSLIQAVASMQARERLFREAHERARTP